MSSNSSFIFSFISGVETFCKRDSSLALNNFPASTVINKSAGVVIHPGAGNLKNTMVNGLLFLYQNQLSGIAGKLRPGIVHRIDKDTSGILVVAKNDNSHSVLIFFCRRTLKLSYKANTFFGDTLANF